MIVEAFLMEEEKAEEFDSLFETLLVLLKLNHSLTPEIKNHDDWNLTLYSRDSMGMSNFSMSISATLKEYGDEWLASEVHIKIISEDISLISVDIFDMDFNLDKYSCDFSYDENKMLSMMRQLVRCI